MHAYIYTLAIPALLMMLMDHVLKRQEDSWKVILKRYTMYTFFVTLLSMLSMLVVCEQGESFVAKVDRDAFFALKYLFLEVVAAFVVGMVEYILCKKELPIVVQGFGNLTCKVNTAKTKWMGSVLFYLLAMAVVGLNLLLVFDNVVWGDEAYSANLVRNNLEGIMQVLYYEENHPPFYYFWLRLFVNLFGNSILVCHLASYVLFVLGILFAISVLAKRVGKLPASFFIVISGLSATCVEYNVEIRMYALAFMATAFCAYSAYRVLEDGKIAWFTMVLWGLVAAYSHYYGLLAVVFLMIYTCLIAIYRFGKKYWIRTLLAGFGFIAGYCPWLSFLFKTLGKVSNNWWKDAAPKVSDALDVMFAGHQMRKALLPLLLILFLFILLYESKLITIKWENGKVIVVIGKVNPKEFSANLWFLFAGFASMCTVVGIAYAVCFLVKPLLSVRYLYSLTAIMLIMLVAAVYRVLQIAKEMADAFAKQWIVCLTKAGITLLILVLLVVGVRDYNAFRVESDRQETQTAETMQLMQDMTEETALVNQGVKHIGWTVLHYYYPENEVYNGGFREVPADDMWFFSVNAISEDDILWLQEQGYQVAGYGEHGISKYDFNLYHFYK